jgi:intracellular sulfur oxidation DsrE/DsrF family protein
MTGEIPDEILHAFVDGELAADESERLIARVRDDASLAARVCELRNLRSMVRTAYAEPPLPARRVDRSSRTWRAGLAAAVAVLAIGVAAGWMLRGLDGAPDALHLARIVAPAGQGKVLLHLDSAEPERMQTALDAAERLLDEAERQGRATQVEIVANSQGIGLLRAGVSPHAARIAQLHARHVNLQFVACGQTIARLAGEGDRVVLLPAVRTAPTAVGEIVDRLQQGWTYVRI